jgi:putative nucleotidyltransferase with HDIG domain
MAEQSQHKESIFQSRLARRIFINFIACALVPLTALAVIVFYQVTYEMERQTRSVLDREIKSVVLGLFERLLMQQMQLDILADAIQHEIPEEPQAFATTQVEKFRHGFESAAFVDAAGAIEMLFGQMGSPPKLSASHQSHIADGNTTMVIDRTVPSGIRIMLARQVATGPARKGNLWVEVDTAHLWQESITKHLPYGSEACLFDAQGQTIFSSFSFPQALQQRVLNGLRHHDRGNFELDIEGEAYAASFRSLPLKMQFMVPDWSVVLIQQKDELARTIKQFKVVFPLVILIAIGIVVLLSINLIRSSLGPLRSLIHGTSRIAHKDFGSRIEVTSKDEFKDLAWAFNDMSAQLDQQFRAMSARSEVDRAILSFLDKDSIAAAIIGGIDKIFHCDRIGIGMLESGRPEILKTFDHRPGQGDVADIETGWSTVQSDELETLLSSHDQVMTYEDGDRPTFLLPFKARQIGYQVVLPVVVKDQMAAFIVLGYHRRRPECREHIQQARKMADQMAVAMANAMLVTDLNQSHWGALHALARAVDAKSPWTAGHSERVAQNALQIGRALGLGEAELNHLHRGALLHDLGKIGVPAAILDKNGRLTDDEFAKIKAHPTIGARILEPIVEFKEVTPLVSQHHERYDGKGYPLRLDGENIDWGARILAVADVYDALLSDRPYRKGWPEKKVLAVIEQGAGSQFDPNVVTVFLSSFATSVSGAPSQTTAAGKTGSVYNAVADYVELQRIISEAKT